MTSTRRLFIGIALPNEIAEPLHAAVRDCFAPQDAARLRIGAARDFHATLVFLGSVDEAQIPTLCAELKRALEAQRVVELALDGTGAFPSPARARVLWAAAGTARESDTSLDDLQRAAFSAAVAAGVLASDTRADEPFRAHVTVARVRERLRREALGRFLELEFRAPWRVDEVALFESIAGQSPTPRASSVGRYPMIERVRLNE